jgi:hypothetical protein
MRMRERNNLGLKNVFMSSMICNDIHLRLLSVSLDDARQEIK